MTASFSLQVLLKARKIHQTRADWRFGGWIVSVLVLVSTCVYRFVSNTEHIFCFWHTFLPALSRSPKHSLKLRHFALIHKFSGQVSHLTPVSAPPLFNAISGIWKACLYKRHAGTLLASNGVCRELLGIYLLLPIL